MDGFLIVDKPKGITSFDVIRILKKEIGRKVKIGHTGTLDPLATGILILAIGKATKFSSYFLKRDKCYSVTAALGLKSDTYDVDGKVETVKCPEIPKQKFTECIESFKGEISQVPPIYSAIRVNGKRAYELARQGKKFTLKPRKIHIYSIDLIGYDYPEFSLNVCCSSGTYIRSLVHDIGVSLGCDAVVKEIRRTKVGSIKVSEAIPLDRINKNNIQSFLIPIKNFVE